MKTNLGATVNSKAKIASKESIPKVERLSIPISELALPRSLMTLSPKSVKKPNGRQNFSTVDRN